MSEIRVNTFKAEDGISAPSFPNGIQVTGVVTATSLASSVPHLNVGNNIQLGASGVTTATTFIGALTGNVNGNATGLSGTPNITVGSVVASTGTFSGNVSIGGTLTYEDVLNIDSVGIVTAREGIFIPDSKDIKLGNNIGSPDLKINHDGGHSNIHHTGTGNFHIRGNDSDEIKLQAKSGEQSIICKPDGAVEIYHDNSKKLESTSSGVTVTGTVTDSNGNLRSIPLQNETGAHVLNANGAGRVIYISTGGVTVNPSVFSGGEAVTIINNSGSAQTITQGSSMTLHFTSDGTSGNRTLGARGMATVWFAAHNIAYISGSGLT